MKGDVPTLGVGNTPARFFSLFCVCCCCCALSGDGFAWFDSLTLILIRPDGQRGAGSGWESISSISFLGVCSRLILCAANALHVSSKSNSKRFRLDRSMCCKVKRSQEVGWQLALESFLILNYTRHRRESTVFLFLFYFFLLPWRDRSRGRSTPTRQSQTRAPPSETAKRWVAPRTSSGGYTPSAVASAH